MFKKPRLDCDAPSESSQTVKVIVFDFDLTLTKKHTVSEPAKSKEEMLDNIYRSEDLREVFCGLNKAGYILCVASFAKKERIICYLDALLEKERSKLFKDEDIYGNNDYDGVTGDHRDGLGIRISTAGNLKITWLAEICERHKVDPEKVLLVDDGERNLEDASEAGYQTLDGSSSSSSSSSSGDKKHFIDVLKGWVLMDKSNSSALFSPHKGLSCSCDAVPNPSANSRSALTVSM